MELDYWCQYGDCHDIISKARKHWSLAHDVKLLKYLESFSQNLMSRTRDVLKCVEGFEEDVNSVSISMQTVSQSFQSLANTQFIEHTVLEDDISAYSKTTDNDMEVGEPGSNVLLLTALSSCLTSVHLNYNKHKDNIHSSTSHHNSCEETTQVLSPQMLPPLIGSLQFTQYYHKLFGIQHIPEETTEKPQVTCEENSSDKQSFLESVSLCSSSNDNERTSLHPDSTNSSHIGEGDWNAENIYPCDNMPSAHPQNLAQNNSLITNNDSDSLVTPQNSHLFLPHQNILNNHHDLFSTKPFVENVFDEDDEDDLFSSFSEKSKSLYRHAVAPLSDPVAHDTAKSVLDKNAVSALSDSGAGDTVKSVLDKNAVPALSDSGAGDTAKSVLDKNPVPALSDSGAGDTAPSKPKLHQPTNLSFPTYSNQNSTVSSNYSDNHLTDASSAQAAKKISPSSSTGKTEHVLDKNDPNVKEEAQSTVQQTPSFSSSIISSSPSNQNQFSLFSENQDSEDELFLSPSRNKITKENFKKILEGKISSMVGNPNFKGSLSKNKHNEPSNENSDNPERSLSNQTFDESNSLPSCDTPMLQSLAKSRPRIKSKRRPPSRKHLKEIHSSEQSGEVSAAVSILSPSTEEEDLFVVGTTSMHHQASSSNLFLASSLLSPGSSLDNQNLTDTFVPQHRISDNNVKTEKHDSLSNSKSSNDDMNKEDSSSGTWLSKNECLEKPSSKFAYDSKISLFNDTDEDDDDDLFSSCINRKLNRIKPQTQHKADEDSAANHNTFKDIFSNSSDDEDLFKIKQTPSESKQQTTTPGHSKPAHINGRKVLESSQDFNDPLSLFNSQTD